MDSYCDLDHVPRILHIDDTPVPAGYCYALLSESGTGKRRSVFCLYGSSSRDRLIHKDIECALASMCAFHFILSCLERGTIFINGGAISLHRGTLAASEERRREIAELLSESYPDHAIIFH